MTKCINRNHPNFIAVSQANNNNPLLANMLIEEWQNKNNSDNIPTLEELEKTSNIINPIGNNNNFQYKYKFINKIINNLDKVYKWFDKIGNNDTFWNKLGLDLQIPKEQINLLKQSEGDTINKKLLDFLTNYSYTVEINTTVENEIEQFSVYEIDGRYFVPDFDEGGEHIEITKKQYEDSLNEKTPTSYYSDLTVAGGTNYTENEIATPAITPSIEGHAQFSTDKGIGWFRSDDKISKIDGFSENKNAPKEWGVEDAIITEPKTRRILEVQSDLFQKLRNNFKFNGVPHNIIIPVDNNGKKVYLIDEKEVSAKEYNQAFENFIDADGNNKFLALLHKDNNWVTFFIKSIIQDSAKKGYEKVLFPSGNTASKVEGHTTLEQFKKQKEGRLNTLNNQLEEINSLKLVVKNEKVKKYIKSGNNSFFNGYETVTRGWEFRDKEGFSPAAKYTKISNKLFNSIALGEDAIKSVKKDLENEINQIKKELERVEIEGFGALKPIFNFYENTITNILKKNYSVKQITDEYGNTWNEVEISPDFSSPLEAFSLTKEGKVARIETEEEAFQYLVEQGILNTRPYNNERTIRISQSAEYQKFIKSSEDVENFVQTRLDKLNKINAAIKAKYGIDLYFAERYGKTYKVKVHPMTLALIKQNNTEGNQLQTEGIPDDQLDSRIQNFLDKLGIEVKTDGVTDRWNNPIPDAIARAKFTHENLKAVIDIVESKRGLDTLTEEATHFLVWMLRGTPLYKTLYKETLSTELFKQVKQEYGHYYKSELEIVEEAMTKRITQAVIELDKSGLTEEEFKRTNRWWNRLLSWFKEKLGILKKDSVNEAAMKVLFADTTGLSLANIKNNNEAYQLNADQQVDKYAQSILDRNIILEEKEHIYFEDEFEYPKSVTQATKKERDFDKLEGMAEKRAEFLREFGNKGHAYFKNALIRAVEERELGSERTARVETVPKEAVDKIDTFVKDLVNSFPTNTRFIIEKPIGDKKKGIAGTPDLFVIYKDKDDKTRGVILDWKFTNFISEKGKITQQELSRYKKEDYQKQLREYRRIYKEVYGIDIDIDASLFPISVNIGVNDKKEYIYKSIEIGNMEFNHQKLYLNRIPLETERTGLKTQDSILDSLTEQKRKLKDSTPKTEKEQARKTHKLIELEKAIKQIIITKDLEAFFDVANGELNSIISDVNLTTLRNAVDLIPYYKSLNFSEYRNNLTEDKREVVNTKINNFLEKLQDVEAIVNDNLEKLVNKAVEELGITNLNEHQLDIGWWSKIMGSLSTKQNPYLKALYQLIMKAKDTARINFEKNLTEIDKLNKGVLEYAEANGIKNTDAFNFMYKTDKHGNIVLINKFSKESFSLVEQARASKDFKFLKANLVFNKEKYTQRYEHTKAYYENFYVDNPTKVKELLENYEKENNAEKYESAYLNRKNYSLSLNDKTLKLSEEYKHIQSNSQLKEFYDYFTNFVNNSRKELGLDIDFKFIPQISQSIIEGVTKQGKEFSFTDNFFNSIAAGDNGMYGEINSITGNPEYSIGMTYQKSLGKDASTDLGKVLALWAKRYHEVKQLTDVEDTAQLLKSSLEKQELLVPDMFGNPAVDKETGEAQLVTALNSNTLEAFKGYMNEAFYNISSKQDIGFTVKRKRPVLKDGEIQRDENDKVITEEYDMNISGVKALNKFLNYVSSKTLGLNLISAGANLSGGIINGIYEGQKGRFYTKRNFVKAVKYISGGNLNPKTMTALKYFDIMGDMEGFNKANNLSVSKAEKWFTYDKIFALQKQGDTLIHNSILISMLQTHGLDANNKIKHLRELPEGTKSLFDSMEIEDDNLKIAGLTDNADNIEYLKFRRKVHEVGKKILGNAPSYDIKLVNQSILGRLAMQFRGWIPRMAEERFGAVRYNQNLEDFEQGKFFSFGQFLLKNITTNTGTVLKTLIGIGNNIDEVLGNQWDMMDMQKKQMFIKNSASEAEAKQAYIQLQKANIRSSIMEIYTVLGVFLMYANAVPDDDERANATGVRKVYVKMLDRLHDELSFFLLPTSFNDIMSNFIPATNTLIEINNLVGNLGGETAAQLIGSEDMKKKYKPVKHFGKVFPITHEAVKDLTIIFGNDYWEEFKTD
jgi:hypothetical protein